MTQIPSKCIGCSTDIVINTKGKSKQRCEECAKKRNIELTQERRRQKKQEEIERKKQEETDKILLSMPPEIKEKLIDMVNNQILNHKEENESNILYGIGITNKNDIVSNMIEKIGGSYVFEGYIREIIRNELKKRFHKTDFNVSKKDILSELEIEESEVKNMIPNSFLEAEKIYKGKFANFGLGEVKKQIFSPK